MKTIIRSLLFKTLLRPTRVRHCNQTIYEALLGCVRMWEATGRDEWKDRAGRVLEIQLSNQLSDGGFEIGYSFNFGRIHKKGEATSPDLISLLALVEYYRLLGDDRVRDAARRAAEWIRRNAIDMGDGKWGSPYCPYSVRAVWIYNGTSFAVGALGRYLGCMDDDPQLRTIYEGMIAYLDGVMSADSELPGRFWYYADQSRDGLTQLQREQIDYYHQAQQVEMHSLAQQVAPVERQVSVIRDAADHIVAVQNGHGILPYTNLDVSPAARVPVWGLCSVVPGLLEAGEIVPERRDDYRKAGRFVLDWLLDNAWNGEYFCESPDRSGRKPPKPLDRYMVRSDAWVFGALAAAQKHLGDGRWTQIAEKCYLLMESVDFSGPESHASTRLKRMTGRVLGFLSGKRKPR